MEEARVRWASYPFLALAILYKIQATQRRSTAINHTYGAQVNLNQAKQMLNFNCPLSIKETGCFFKTPFIVRTLQCNIAIISNCSHFFVT